MNASAIHLCSLGQGFHSRAEPQGFQARDEAALEPGGVQLVRRCFFRCFLLRSPEDPRLDGVSPLGLPPREAGSRNEWGTAGQSPRGGAARAVPMPRSSQTTLVGLPDGRGTWGARAKGAAPEEAGGGTPRA
jgi:hypothetical protein